MLDDETGRLYHVFDFMSPATNGAGKSMYNSLHIRTAVNPTDLQTEPFLLKVARHPPFQQQFTFIPAFKPTLVKSQVHKYCAHSLLKILKP